MDLRQSIWKVSYAVQREKSENQLLSIKLNIVLLK